MINLIPFICMVFLVGASNYLVQFPLNEWLTLAAFTYPITFFVTELTNRTHGPRSAKRVVYAGFTVAVILSAWLSTPRIALASGAAFLFSQLLDISVFNRFRKSDWWQAPLIASFTASFLDTILFWGIAFCGEPLPYITWALGDFAVKLLLDAALLFPFRLAIRRTKLFQISFPS